MKILLLASASGYGGAEVHTLKLAAALAGRGHSVTIVARGSQFYQGRLDQRDSRLRLRALGGERMPSPMGYREWRGVFRTMPANVAVLAKSSFRTGSIGLDLAARFSFGRYFTIEHSLPPVKPAKASRSHAGGLVPGLGLWWYRERVANYLRSVGPVHVYCVSDAVRDALLANCAFPQRKVSTVRNGVDADRFRPNEDWRKKWRAALGVSDDTLVFGSVGRLVPEKAYDTIIRLFASLAGEMPGTPMRLVLVGTGPEEEALRGVARTSGAGHLVAFFGFSECPWEVICAFDVFLLLSRTEGLGLSLCEAMACECFCIASATGGMPEVISERSVGWLVPPEDEKAILEAMRATVRMPTGERREIGRSARKHMVANFNEAAQMANLADLLCRTNIA